MDLCNSIEIAVLTPCQHGVICKHNSSAVFRQPDVSSTNPNSSHVRKETCCPLPDLGLIRLVNSTYKVRGDLVTTRQLWLLSNFDVRDGKWMINAPLNPLQRGATCAFNSICSHEPHIGRKVCGYECMCLHRHKRAFVTTGEWHHRVHCGTAESWD